MKNKSLSGQHVVVVGGGSGIGLQTVKLVRQLGARVTIASRSQKKLEAAAELIGDGVDIAPVDFTDEERVKRWALDLGNVDHLIITASSSAHGAFSDAPTQAIRDMFSAKFFGPYVVAREVLPNIAPGGSITLFSGVLSRRPAVGASGLGAVNSAVEGLVRGLALELGSVVRVNGISPGMVKTEAYSNLSDDARDAMFQQIGNSLPIGRVGEPEEIANVVSMVIQNQYLNGAIIDIDGGHMVRQ